MALLSDAKFLEKMKEFGLQTGKMLVEEAFSLWYVMHESTVPTQAKLIVGGALAYWIFPVEMIPDILPAVGFTDDFAIIESALANITMCVTPEIKARANQQTEALFGGKQILEGETTGEWVTSNE